MKMRKEAKVMVLVIMTIMIGVLVWVSGLKKRSPEKFAERLFIKSLFFYLVLAVIGKVTNQPRIIYAVSVTLPLVVGFILLLWTALEIFRPLTKEKADEPAPADNENQNQ